MRISIMAIIPQETRKPSEEEPTREEIALFFAKQKAILEKEKFTPMDEL
ncbi:hypothetical protein JW721_03925 [Candidatus Micrarchaeota archaeon]|nr:hypothetical protein [Candidatus Micrarchaeota archaeon]